MINQKGQSLVEVIFAIGILTIVITAVVSLIVKTTGVRSVETDRKKASEMSAVIVEQLLESKNNNPDSFWQLNDITTPQTVDGFDGFTYVVDFTPNHDGNCNTSTTECANAKITINWGNNQFLTVTRFFSKKS